jgi:hypothetical protein
MTASTLTDAAARAAPRKPFPPAHPWDRNFFLLWVALIWFGIAIGFGPEVFKHFAKHERAFPLITHIHGAAFGGWLVLLTAQVLLIRTRRVAVHRKLGWAMVAWGAAIPVLGLAVAWNAQLRDFGTPASDPGFYSIQLIDCVSFTVLCGAGVLLRNSASAHKRLMLLGTLCIADAGYGRLTGPLMENHFGKGFSSEYLGLYGATGLMIVGIGAYDLITRKRLHPAYVAGAAWGLAGQALATFLWHDAAWVAYTTRLFHH